MTIASIVDSVRKILINITWSHWVLIAVLTLAVLAVALARRKASAWGVAALCLAVFSALLLLEATVAIRACGIARNGWGIRLNLDLGRLLHLHSQGYVSFFNIVAFVPFGFFLAEYLAARRRDGSRPIGPGQSFFLSTLITLGLSLIIESLQLALRVGLFELTDLVMNTLGGLVGAGLSLTRRSFV